MLYFNASDNEFSVERLRYNLLLRHANCFFCQHSPYTIVHYKPSAQQSSEFRKLVGRVAQDITGEIVFRDHRINKLADVYVCVCVLECVYVSMKSARVCVCIHVCGGKITEMPFE